METAMSLNFKRIGNITLIRETAICWWSRLWHLQCQRIKKEHKEEAKADEEATVEEDKEATVPLVTQVNIILHSIFSNLHQQSAKL